jgi:hypothetical protein
VDVGRALELWSWGCGVVRALELRSNASLTAVHEDLESDGSNIWDDRGWAKTYKRYAYAPACRPMTDKELELEKQYIYIYASV